jgi:hypothetical protein
MTKAPLIRILQPIRSTSSSWLSTFLLLSGFILLPATAQVGLPGTAISIPTDQPLAAGLQHAEQCKINNQLIVLPPIPFQFGADGNADNSLVEEQAKAIESVPKGSDLWLHAIASGDLLTGKETEKQLADRIDALLQSMPLASPAVRGFIVEVKDSLATPDLYSFALLRLALTAKSSKPGLRLAFVFQPGFIARHGDLVKRLALYADLLGMTYTADWHKDAAWIAEQALNKPLIVKLESLASTMDSYALAAELAASGTSVQVIWSQPKDASDAEKACTSNSLMKRVIPDAMLRVSSSSVPFKLTVDGQQDEETWWFGSGRSPDLAMVAHINADPNHSRQITLTSSLATHYEVQWFDPATGVQILANEPTATAGNWTQTVSSTSEYLILSFHKKGNPDSTVYNSVEVRSGVDLSVEEIIARWQQYSEAQRQKLENYISSSFMNLHFESTNVVSAFDVSMQIKRFYDRSGQMELAQTALYVNGVKFNNKYEFPLPQLEPEKVLAPPLELKLNERYVYKLLGTEKIDSVLCFVVGVEPKVQDVSLYSGKIWIDGTTFREVKQTLNQRGDQSNIVANIETQNYELVSDGKGNRFNLLHSISEQQTLNAAGRDFLLQRTIQFTGYEINTPQFNSSLQAERNSQDPMYRDTDNGLRTLKKQGNDRILVQDTQKRISSIVAGAMYEGTFNFPIPIAGLTIADFDYRHTGAQLSTFFAGVLLATDLSRQYGTKYRLSADLALSAIPGEERLYTGNTEATGAEIYAWAEDIGGRATWLTTPHLSLTATGYLEYDFFHTTSDTSSQYVVPRNGIAFIPGAQIRFTDKGYIFTADGSRGQRIGWKQFGCTAASLQLDGCSPPQPLESGYTLYDADLNKDYYFKKFTRAGWDASFYGGNQLDRFSRYFPSIFSQPNIHGIPSGTDSFDAIAMVNAHYGFNVMDIVKFDLMYNYARARNEEESSQFRKFDGLESHINTPGPFGTLIQSTVSYALDGNINRYNSRFGVLFMIFKPLH